MRRIDGYLSGKAQAVEPSALVICERYVEGGAEREEWTLELPDEVLALGESFRDAKQAVKAWAKSRRAKEASGAEA